MGDRQRRLGLRLLELEAGIATNVDDYSPDLVDYASSRTVGQAARLAMLVRGQDVIEDERRLRMIAARELHIVGGSFDDAKRALQEADLLEEKHLANGKRVLYEKVERLNHANNYERLGSLWVSRKDRTHREEALVETLDRVVDAPTSRTKIDALTSLPQEDQTALLEIAGNACLIDSVIGGTVLYSPLLWELSPQKVEKFLQTCTETQFKQIIERFKLKPGTDLTGELNGADPLVSQAVSGGIVPSYRVNSTGGERVYGFAPYAGRLITGDEQVTVLDKARAIVACLRYGSEAATITRIRSPRWIINAMLDKSRNYTIGPHSELKDQYGMLVLKGIGRVSKVGYKYQFEVIPTQDNLLACALAKELITGGEVIGDKDPGTDSALNLITGTVGHPLAEVKVAKKKRAARADELANLVEHLREF